MLWILLVYYLNECLWLFLILDFLVELFCLRYFVNIEDGLNEVEILRKLFIEREIINVNVIILYCFGYIYLLWYLLNWVN